MFLPLLIIAIIIIAFLSFVLVCYMLNPFKLKQFNQNKSTYKNFRSGQSSDNTSFNDASTKYCSDDSAVITLCNGHTPVADRNGSSRGHVPHLSGYENMAANHSAVNHSGVNGGSTIAHVENFARNNNDPPPMAPNQPNIAGFQPNNPNPDAPVVHSSTDV